MSQLAVIKAEPPLAAAEVVGAVYERDLMQRAVDDPGVLDEPVEQVMGPPLADSRKRRADGRGGQATRRMPRRCSCWTAATLSASSRDPTRSHSSRRPGVVQGPRRDERRLVGENDGSRDSRRSQSTPVRIPIRRPAPWSRRST